MNNFKISEVVKFLTVGIVNTFFGLMIIYLTKWIFNAGDISANIIGYAVGAVVSFTLNSHWTFSHVGPHIAALIRFILAVLLAYGVNLLAVLIAIHYLKFDGYLAQALGVPPYTLTFYLASKYFVFKVKKNRE